MSDDVPASNRADLTDLDRPVAPALGGHAPGSASPFPAVVPAPQPANPAPPPITPPAPPSTAPPPDAAAPTRPLGEPAGHPALGPQFRLQGAHAIATSANKATAAQATAGEGPIKPVKAVTTPLKPTTGWQHS